MKTVQLGIVGFGGMGNWHRETVGTVDGIALRGVYDIKEERRQFARNCGVLAYESLEAMLADPAIDLILVSTPNDLHKEIAVRALGAGKHVISEKPVTLSCADLEEMIDAATQNDRLFTVHQNRRWDEDYLTIREIYERQLLGDVFRIESRVHGSRGIPGDWRQRPEQGGGMIYDWGIHLIDQILMMIPAEPVSVYTTVTHVTNELVDDGFTAEFLFANGQQALVEVGTSNFTDLPRWYLLGRDGTAVIEDWALNGKIVRCKNYDLADAVPVRTAAGLTKTMAPRTAETISEEPLPTVKSDVRDFYRNVLAVIEGRETPIVTLSEQRRLMRVIEAVFESARANRVVSF